MDGEYGNWPHAIINYDSTFLYVCIKIKNKKKSFSFFCYDSRKSEDPKKGFTFFIYIYAVVFGKEMSFSSADCDLLKSYQLGGSLRLCHSLYGHFIEGVQSEIRSMGDVSFIFVQRNANTVTHTLAKLATTHVTDVTWSEEIPPVICGIVGREEVLPPV